MVALWVIILDQVDQVIPERVPVVALPDIKTLEQRDDVLLGGVQQLPQSVFMRLHSGPLTHSSAGPERPHR